MRRFSGFMSEEEKHRWGVSWPEASLLHHHLHQSLPPHDHLTEKTTWMIYLHDTHTKKKNLNYGFSSQIVKKTHNPFTKQCHMWAWVYYRPFGRLLCCFKCAKSSHGPSGSMICCQWFPTSFSCEQCFKPVSLAELNQVYVSISHLKRE